MNWHEFFFYLDGEIYWKERPRDHFKNEAAWKHNKKVFCGKRAGAIVGSPRSATRYRQTEVWSKAHKNHRIIWEMHNGPIPDGMVVDHINGNGLDNRIENLRLVDSVDSAHNLPMLSSNTTGIVGVNWHNSARAWQARICMAGKRIDLGRYPCLLDAVAARIRAEREYGYHKNHGRQSSVHS